MSVPAIESPCDKLKKTVIDQHIDAETIEAIREENRTMPMFEKSMFELKFKKMYSLRNNERLACHWAEYINRKPGDFKSFRFPSFRDLHFYKNSVYLVPFETPTNRKDFTKKMAVGPGVDSRGQMPIPNELHLRKGKAPPSKASEKRQTKLSKEVSNKKNATKNKGKETTNKQPDLKTKTKTTKKSQ